MPRGSRICSPPRRVIGWPASSTIHPSRPPAPCLRGPIHDIRFTSRPGLHRPSAWDAFRRDFQIVFQGPYTSLNPRHTVYEILAEPLRVHRIHEERHIRDAVAGLLEKVGLAADYMHRFPHAFSGGQRQRIGIARAIGVRPKLIVCDEVVAALDVSVQAQVIQLLMDLKRELGLSLLFISHDLSLVKSVSDRVLVMYLGRIAEESPADALFAAPRHPYTAALLDSIPTLARGHRPKLLGGEIPSPVNLPKGCAFAGRCPRAQDRCRRETPELFEAGEGRMSMDPRNRRSRMASP